MARLYPIAYEACREMKMLVIPTRTEAQMGQLKDFLPAGYFARLLRQEELR